MLASHSILDASPLQFTLPTALSFGHAYLSLSALIDSGAEASFIDQKFALLSNVSLVLLNQPVRLQNF